MKLVNAINYVNKYNQNYPTRPVNNSHSVSTIHSGSSINNSNLSSHELVNDLNNIINQQNFNKVDFQNSTDILRVLKENLPQADIKLIKGTKWHADSSVFKVQSRAPKSSNDYVIALKVHENKYPIGSHLYNHPELLSKAINTGFVPKIFFTKVLNDALEKTSTNVPKKHIFVAYEFVDGQPLDKIINKASERDIDFYLKSINQATYSLTQIGAHPFIKDLGDVIVTNGNPKKIVITDINCLLPIDKSDLYARQHIHEITQKVYKSLINVNYKPYIEERPTMANLSPILKSAIKPKQSLD